MNTKRAGHACFIDQAASAIYVVGGRRLNSTEKWTFGQNSWEPSASLPVALEDSAAVSSNTDNFIGYMAGGWWRKENGRAGVSQNIYGLTRSEMTWIKLNKTMKIGRWFHSLLNIPANQVLGC